MNMAKMRQGMPREGNTHSKLLQLIQAVAYNEGITFVNAEVRKVAPNLAIRVHGDPYDLEDDDIIVADHLLEHKRMMSINGGEDVEVTIRSPLEVGDIVVVAVTECQQLNYVLYKR